MIPILLSLLILTALALLAYSLSLSSDKQPQMRIMISGVKVYNDHRLTKTLNKTMMRTLQKPTVMGGQCNNSVPGRFSRRSSSSSTESSAPTVVGEPTTSSAHLRGSKI